MQCLLTLLPAAPMDLSQSVSIRIASMKVETGILSWTMDVCLCCPLSQWDIAVEPAGYSRMDWFAAAQLMHLSFGFFGTIPAVNFVVTWQLFPTSLAANHDVSDQCCCW